MTRSIEPCLCGDPECHRCFPRSEDYNENDEDIEYEKERQKETDNEQTKSNT